MRLLCNKKGRKAIPLSRIEGVADVPMALIYVKLI